MTTPLQPLAQAAAVLLAGLSGALAAPWQALPDSASVTDAATGLIWMRCSLGQRWQAPNCMGEASLLTWQQAQNAAHQQAPKRMPTQVKALPADLAAMPFASGSGGSPVAAVAEVASDPAAWRVPTVRELLTLVDRTRVDPAPDAATFPNTPNTSVWSATRNAQHAGQAWHVHFGHGGVYEDGTWSDAKAVRLVRGNPSPALSDARAASDYVIQGDGTVTHRPSGLVWQRCLVGQSWSGSACSGSASTLSWAAAVSQFGNPASQANWRLPTQDELLSLVDYTQPGRAINTAVFPDTPGKAFWSATPHANAPQHGWYVMFAYDCAYYRYYQGSNAVVRLVRSGQGDQ